VSDRFGRGVVVAFGGAMEAAGLALTYFANGSNSTYIYYLAAAALGFADCAIQTQIMALLGAVYNTQAPEAFAVFRLLMSLGATVPPPPLFGSLTDSVGVFYLAAVWVRGGQRSDAARGGDFGGGAVRVWNGGVLFLCATLRRGAKDQRVREN
jgi:MFS family permease